MARPLPLRKTRSYCFFSVLPLLLLLPLLDGEAELPPLVEPVVPPDCEPEPLVEPEVDGVVADEPGVEEDEPEPLPESLFVAEPVPMVPEEDGVLELLEEDGELELPEPEGELELLEDEGELDLPEADGVLELDELELPEEGGVTVVELDFEDGVVAVLEPEPPAGGVEVELRAGALELLPLVPELLEPSPQPTRASMPNAAPAKRIRLSINASPLRSFHKKGGVHCVDAAAP